MDGPDQYNFSDLEQAAQRSKSAQEIVAIRAATQSIARHLERQEEGTSQTRRIADLLTAILEQNKMMQAKQDRTNDLLSRVNAHAMGCLIVLLVIAWRIW